MRKKEDGEDEKKKSGANRTATAATAAAITTTTAKCCMATALSLDHWSAPPESMCHCESSPDLAVNFLCMHPPPLPPSPVSSHTRPIMSPPSPPNKRTAARFQEIFVDLVGMHASTLDAASRHILDERFDSFLGTEERAFKEAVLGLMMQPPVAADHDDNGDDYKNREGRGVVTMKPEARETEAFRVLQRLLREKMGLDGLDELQQRRVRRMRELRRLEKKDSTKGSQEEDDFSMDMDSITVTTVSPHPNTKSAGDYWNCQTQMEEMPIIMDADGDSADDTNIGILHKVIATIRSNEMLRRTFAFALTDLNGERTPSEEQILHLLVTVPSPPGGWDNTKLGTNSVTMDMPPRVCSLLKDTKLSSAINAREEFLRLFRPPGHVFICNASVCDINCDAFLCPGSVSCKKNSIRGRIWRQWYRSLRSNHRDLLGHLIQGCDGMSANNSSKRVATGSGIDVSGRNSDNSRHQTHFPLKRDDCYDRIATLCDWPWDEFRAGNLPHCPFLVAGEVSIEQSRLRQPRRAVRYRNETVRPPFDAPSKDDHLDALMETVRQFVHAALMELRNHQPRPHAGRERYVLALPVVGTGGGHAGDLTGHVVEKMLQLLSEIVTTMDDVDCVIVCADEATYSHAQNVRSKMCNLSPTRGSSTHRHDDNDGTWKSASDDMYSLPCFRLLTPQMREYALHLAELASGGQLSLFVGAGVSIGSGLPGWFDLLQCIEDQFTPTGAPAERTLGDETGWDPLVMADRLDEIASSRPDRDGLTRTLKKRVCHLIECKSRHPGLLLSMLSSLPCKSVVTQNYDRLIERAYKCLNVAERTGTYFDETTEMDLTDESLSVIPYSPVRGAPRWLLKMHGCVTAPEDIVLTGEDYRTYEEGRMRALAGLVQANLMTTHLLFVGYSMTDPNYLRIIEEVRQALRPRMSV